MSALGLLLGQPTAHAAVDLTGSWKVTVSLGSPLTTVYFAFVQSGSDLTLTRSGLGSVMGTIQPGTGAFDFDLGPFTALDAPTGPTHFITGTAAPDSQSFTGQENQCIYEIGLGWGCLTFNLDGVPGSPPAPVCGNGILEAGEACDRGLSNGPSCCTTSCVLVDQDGDHVCDLLDNCPRTANANQLDQDTDCFGDVCDPSTIGVSTGDFQLHSLLVRITVPPAPAQPARRLFVRGIFNGSMVVPTTLQLRDIDGMNIDLASLPAWTSKVCRQRATRITCASPDGSLRLRLKKHPGDPSVRIKLVLRNPPLSPPFAEPLFISMHSSDGGRRFIISDCRLNPAGSLQCRG